MDHIILLSNESEQVKRLEVLLHQFDLTTEDCKRVIVLGDCKYSKQRLYMLPTAMQKSLQKIFLFSMCCQNHAPHINVLPLSNFLIHKSFNLREIYIIIIIIWAQDVIWEYHAIWGTRFRQHMSNQIKWHWHGHWHWLIKR